jgi:hypothetical protein
VGVLLGNRDGTFQAALTTSVPANFNGYGWQLTVADFNCDGKLDVVSGLPGILLLGNGNGKLAAKVLAKEIKRQVIAKQRGWYRRRAMAMNDKLTQP